MSGAPSPPGLCLVAQAGTGSDRLSYIEAALEATEPVTLILTAPESGAFDPAATRLLIEMAQRRKVAALLADDVATARALRADGVHLSWRPEIADAYEAARAALGPDAIVGADAGTSRHDAMTLGEATADYVAFGRMSDAYEDPDEARDEQRDLVSWWADIFVVPVIAFDAETPDDVRDFVRRRVDFIAVRLPDALPAEKIAAWASALVAALRTPANAA